MSERETLSLRQENREGEQSSEYEAPRILFRERLEGVAAACTPQPPGKAEGVCSQGFS